MEKQQKYWIFNILFCILIIVKFKTLIYEKIKDIIDGLKRTRTQRLFVYGYFLFSYIKGEFVKENKLSEDFFKYVTLNILGQIAFSCYTLFDTFFVSKSLGADGLTALNLAYPVSVYLMVWG